MHFLKCNRCGHLNELKSEYLIFCSSCNKKLENNFSDWKRKNPEKTFDEFQRLNCISEEDIQTINVKKKPGKPKGLKYWIGFIVAFSIFYAVGQLAGDKIVGFFRKPAFDKAMMEFAEEINKTCPILLDNATRLDNAVALPGNILQYNYTIVNMIKDSLDVNSLRNYIEPRIINTVKTEPQMKVVRDNKTTVNYSYKDRSGVFLFTISVKPEQYE